MSACSRSKWGADSRIPHPHTSKSELKMEHHFIYKSYICCAVAVKNESVFSLLLEKHTVYNIYNQPSTECASEINCDGI